MSDGAVVGRFVDARKWSRFNTELLMFSFLLMLLDGYDLSAIAFAAPHIMRQWQVPRELFGPVFGAALFGFMIGSPLFGYISDRFGRRISIFLSCALAGGFTVTTIFTSDVTQLITIRFLTGIGIGGIIPTVVALNAEFSPKAVRAMAIMILASAITIGAALPGWLSGWLVGHYGWEGIFAVGGIATLIFSICGFLFLPESLKYLAVTRGNSTAMQKILARLGEVSVITPVSQQLVDITPAQTDRSPTQLFADGRGLLTTMLWIVVICIQLVYYFVGSWMPTVLATAKMPISSAALATSIFQLGGTLGTLAFAFGIDRLGIRGLFLLFVFAIPPTVAIGFATSSFPFLMLAVFGAGFFILSTITALTAISAILYPTAIRSSGTGWAFGVGRLGAIAGPVIGGVLIGMGLDVLTLFLCLALPLAVGALASLLMQLRFRGARAINYS